MTNSLYLGPEAGVSVERGGEEKERQRKEERGERERLLREKINQFLFSFVRNY